MSTKVYPFRSGEQFRNVISQFMRVFSGFQCKDGNDGLKRIPVVYGTMDRITASILQQRDHLTNQRIPMFAVNMVGMSIDPNNKRSPKHIDAIANRADTLDVRKAITRTIGPAYLLNFDLNLIASSNTELYEILEQLLLIFNPRVTIRTDTVQKNSDYITEIILDNISSEIQYPLGTDQRVVQIGLSFTVPFRLRYPYTEKDNIIKIIETNLYTETEIPDIEDEVTGEDA
jgi:hypothetical protein